ncbi:MAG: 4-(cytidine 5'-diphospho)-2-C-methyl-D-erythritol kinase [Bryobacteraceae bacterium]|nr:4-(cytidine 5'-diphospho)-2-C-methyl-D-erythritol kinase [Bryobacteraceae bacterium]
MKRLRLKSFAKINLDLRVLHRRTDGYHELRTIFQTISLHDLIEVEYRRSRVTRLEIEGNVHISHNLILQAAEAALDSQRATASLRFVLRKNIPMGAGLGGGSSNAAAVLLAIPFLTGKPLPDQPRIAASLGADVPFFLHGGTALACGTGTELYPLPDARFGPGLLIAPEIHSSTADAYRALNRPPQEAALTSPESSSKINGFQHLVWSLSRSRGGGSGTGYENDFEPAVFRQYPQLAKLLRALERQGAAPARMSGSGSSLFGFWESNTPRDRAAAAFPGQRVERIQVVSRSRYQRIWLRQLQPDSTGGLGNRHTWLPPGWFGQ